MIRKPTYAGNVQEKDTLDILHWALNKNMKRIKILAGLLTGLVLVSCDDTTQFITEVNEKPTLEFENGTDTFDQLVKTSLKGNGASVIRFKVYFKDPNGNLDHALVSNQGGDGQIEVNAEKMGVDTFGDVKYKIQGSEGSIEITYFPPEFDPDSKTGNTDNIQIAVLDAFNEVATAVAQITTFVNYKPVAVIGNAANIAINHPQEYEIDLSESYDPDKEQGGGISHFIIAVGDVSFQVQGDSFRYVFQPGKAYKVTAIAVDNDGATSQTAAEKSFTF